MTTFNTLRSLRKGDLLGLIAGLVLLVGALGNGSWLSGLIGIGLLGRVGWKLYSRRSTPDTRQPWPWPADFRSQAEALARPIDPTPKRILPPDDKASIIAQIATSPEALSQLRSAKPPAWPWALFTSVLLQRRSEVQSRLRTVASSYQPRPGVAAISGQGYSEIAYRAMTAISDLVGQTEQFMLSPAFKGAFGADENSADPDAVVAVANRLMDYHDGFLAQAQTCLQTPVLPEALVFVQDMGAFALCPLLGYHEFIGTMCTRIGEAQDLLPYTKGGDVVALDDVSLTMRLPEGLSERVLAHIKEFNP